MKRTNEADKLQRWILASSLKSEEHLQKHKLMSAIELPLTSNLTAQDTLCIQASINYGTRLVVLNHAQIATESWPDS